MIHFLLYFFSYYVNYSIRTRGAKSIQANIFFLHIHFLLINYCKYWTFFTSYLLIINLFYTYSIRTRGLKVYKQLYYFINMHFNIIILFKLCQYWSFHAYFHNIKKILLFIFTYYIDQLFLIIYFYLLLL